jgi:hypothetical protein
MQLVDVDKRSLLVNDLIRIEGVDMETAEHFIHIAEKRGWVNFERV